MIEFEQKNYFMSQLFGTAYYTGLLTLLLLSAFELAKRGFVSFHFNLVWLLLFVLLSGTLYAFFKASPQRSGALSIIIFTLGIVALFLAVAAQIGVDFINKYLLVLIIVINIGLAVYLLKPETKQE